MGRFILLVVVISGLLPAIIMFSVGQTGPAIFALSIAVGVFALIWFVFLRNIFRQARVLKTGEPATAYITGVSDTGITINNNPVVKLALEVTPRRGPKFSTTAKVLVSRINPNAFVPGMTISVKTDPKDPTYVAVDIKAMLQESAAGAPSVASGGNLVAGYEKVLENMGNYTPEQTAAIEKMMRDNEAIRAEVMDTGEDAEGVIMSHWPLGVNIGDEAIGMEFLVEVKIPGVAPFTTEIKGAVSHASIPKYKKGTRVKIKYDPSDPKNRITMNGVV